MRRRATAVAAATGGVLLALAGCGGHKDHAAPATATPSADKGPECVGTAPADGLHVLRGGGFRLPGGGAVQYTGTRAAGATRSAILRDGASYEDGQTSRTVTPGRTFTAGGHEFTVGQICTYRVVLEPASAADRAAAAAMPASLRSTAGGAADNGLCFGTNPAVGAANSAALPAKGGTWVLPATATVKTLPTGVSFTAHAYADSGTAAVTASCAGIQVAGYRDLRVGDPAEFAGARFTLTALTDSAVTFTRTDG